MFDVIENKIYLSRGDSCEIDIIIKDEDGETYTPHEGDKIRFTLKKNTNQCNEILIKYFENVNDDYIISLNESDTINLSFGTYYYDVALIDSSDNVYTIITPTEFEVLEVVHNDIE